MLNIKNGIIQNKEIGGVPVEIDIVPFVTRKHRPGTKSRKDCTVYHDTGNRRPGTDARAHARLLKNWEGHPTNDQTSWHFVVDDQRIVQCIPIDEIAWCQGHKTGNEVGISIEQCIQEGYDRDKAEDNACKLHASLIATLGLRLTKHYDWTRKNCPQTILNRGAWGAIEQKINAYVIQFKQSIPILAPPSTNVYQMQEWARKKGADKLFIDLAQVYYDEAVKAGVDPAVIYTQSAKETAYLKFGGVLDASFKNPCGLKTPKGGDNNDPNAHTRFNTWEDGISAQADHLALYVGILNPNTKDPRHFPFIKGTAKTVAELGTKWAPSADYGLSIERMIVELRSTNVGIPTPTQPETYPTPERAVIQYHPDAKKFAEKLSERLSVPIIDYRTNHNFYPYKMVICVGDQVGVKNFTAYMTHFVNMRDDWAVERGEELIGLMRKDPDRLRRRRDEN